MKKYFLFGLTILFAGLFYSGYTQNTVLHPTIVQQAVYADVTPPLSQMKLIQVRKGKNEADREVPNKIGMNEFNHPPLPPFALGPDPVWQSQDGTYFPAVNGPIQNFEGITNLSGVYPPDTQGDVSLDKYIQVVNLNFAVYSKTGTLLLGPASLSTIWAGIPAPWNGRNDGDPVVLYDQAAGRWMITQFALTSNYSVNAELVAISQTSDPTGSWYRYVFQTGSKMPDYPKFGVWPDGYYMSSNQFINNATAWGGVGAYCFERSKMLTGDASARMVYFDLGASSNPSSMLPSDWDGTVAPVANEPNYFTYFDDWSSPPNGYLKIWQFHVDWTTTANSTFAETTVLTTVPFDSQICTATRGRCINQPSTTIKLEGLTDRLMYRLQYRNFNTYRSMVTNHTVDVDGTGHAGIRWYELRNTGSAWTIYQQGTYSPDASHRWVGSVAMNGNGDIALGYSVSASTVVYPSIRYTGRRASDPLGQMTVAEQTIKDGTGCQTGSSARWGDYSGMSVDPTDDLTFWFTTEYIQTTGSASWQTRIASFKFSNNPSVTTLAASGVTGSAATLNGNINPNGLASTYYFEWGTTLSYGNSTTITSAGSGTSNLPVSAGISGLTAGTTYHYRLVGVNVDGTTYGNDMIIIPGAAAVTTATTSGLTMTTATSGGNVLYDGGFAVTARGVCWSTTINPVATGNHTTDGSGTGTFTSAIAGLTANTTYHVRAYATNVNGTFYGDDIGFTTLCGVYSLPFSESFPGTTIPGCWSQVDNQGNGQIWQFGVITGQSPNPALTGNYAYLNSDAYGSGNSQNADLLTPLLNLSGYSTVNLQFKHYFKSYSGSSGTLSYSINGGTSWTTIQSFTSTSATNPVTFNQAVNAVAGQSQVKFKWNYTGSFGWYWGIDDIQITGTSAVTLSVSPSNQNVTPPAGTTSFSVTCPIAWTATSNSVTWCTVTPSGTGNGTITATYTQNTTVNPRVANITVAATGAPTQVVTVSQSGLTPTLAVTPPNQNVTAVVGTTNFTVTSNTSWTVTSDMSWCTPTASGSGNGTIAANYTENPATTPRIATLTVSVTGLTPQNVTVTQAGAAPTLSVTPSNYNVNSPGGFATFNVTSNSSWTVSSNMTWCIPTPTSGSGNAPFDAIYEENPFVYSRIATLTLTVSGIPPVTVTVTQAGASPTLSVAPLNQNVAAPAGNTIFNVISNTFWSVTSDASWCTATASGSGNGPITANFTENVSVIQRLANLTVTVSGLTPIIVTVTQAGAAPLLSVQPDNRDVPFNAGTTDFAVASNTSWTAVSNASWCTVSGSGTGNGTIFANYSSNPTNNERIATVTVSVNGLSSIPVTVTQAPLVSVDELSSGGIRIYPNPAQGIFKIVSEDGKLIQEIQVIDHNGKVIFSRIGNGEKEFEFDLSSASQGAYMIKITRDHTLLTRKLIISK